MKIQVDYFIDDDRVDDYLVIANQIRSILRRSSDYQHGDLTVSTDITGLRKDVHVAFYIRDCEHMATTRDAMKRLADYLIDECT